MVGQGIIAPLGDGESDRVNSLVITEIPHGRLCICLYPKDLNKVIKREHHPVKYHFQTLQSQTVPPAGCYTGVLESSTF